MKTRVRTDIILLVSVTVAVSVLFLSLRLYPESIFTDDIMNFLGFLLMLKGIYLRMVARGFKKEHSKSGHGLVTGGAYALVRNPMYLGTFLIGSGFVLLSWPWWSIIIFGVIFYVRFKRQIDKEESHLKELFGLDYETYIKQVPRLFPRIKDLLRLRLKEAFPLKQAWGTKEKWGLLGWPFLGCILDGTKEIIVFGLVDWIKVFSIALGAAAVFFITLWVEYKRA